MVDLLDRRLSGLSRYRRLQRCFDGLMPTLAFAFGTAAVLIIVVRLAVPELAWMVLPVMAAAALIPFVRVPSLVRHRDEDALIAGHLDRLCECEGLGMALAAMPAGMRDGGWLARMRQRLETMSLPPFVWRRGLSTILALLCLGIAYMMPQAIERPQLSNVVANLFKHTQLNLDQLGELQALPPDVQQDMKDRLAQLKQHAEQKGMDSATWEGMDRIQGELDDASTRAARRLAAAMVAAEKSASAASPESLDADAGALAQALGDLAVQAPGLIPQLPEGADEEALKAALAKAAAAGLLGEQQLQALQKLGLQGAQKLGKQLTQEQMQGLSQRLLDELAKGVGRVPARGNNGFDSFDDLLEQLRGGQPGRGAPSRGPGHAQLEKTNDQLRTQGGHVEGLPPGARVNADGSVTLAEQIRDAEIDEAAKQAIVRAAARNFDPDVADARSAATAPRHRAAVGKYFATPENEQHAPLPQKTKLSDIP